MLTGLECTLGKFGVRGVTGGNDDRVYVTVVEDVGFVGGGDLEAELALAMFGAAPPSGDDGVQLTARFLCEKR